MEKEEEKFDNSGNESQRYDLDQKHELQKCNEIITKLAVIETTNNVTLRVLEACGENNICSSNLHIEVKERYLKAGESSLLYSSSCSLRQE